jgi:aminopeptidase 2
MGTREAMLSALLLIVATAAVMMPEGIHKAVQVTASDTSYRLPKTVKPISYEVKLKPNFENFTFEGDVKITVQVLEDTSTIILHSNKQDIRNIIVVKDTVQQNTSEGNYDPEKHFLIINNQQNFTADTEYDIYINFTGILSDDMSGFYRSSYTIDGETR